MTCFLEMLIRALLWYLTSTLLFQMMNFVRYSVYLYGINVRPVAPVGSASRKPYVDSALIHRILPDELLFEVFARMTPYNLGRACVCRKWRYTICNPLTGLVENYKLLQSKYEGSWRKMWVLRPRVRTDGLYVSRNTCIRVGVVKWKVTNPLHTLRSFGLFNFSSSRFLHEVCDLQNVESSNWGSDPNKAWVLWPNIPLRGTKTESPVLQIDSNTSKFRKVLHLPVIFLLL
ncbi:hypothetical protein UlMin_006209 [Ulmus minor]